MLFPAFHKQLMIQLGRVRPSRSNDGTNNGSNCNIHSCYQEYTIVNKNIGLLSSILDCYQVFLKNIKLLSDYPEI